MDFFKSANDVISKCNFCTLDEQVIINIIKNNSKVNQEKIAVMLNKSVRTIKSRMTKMQEKELIARKNGKRNEKWIIL